MLDVRWTFNFSSSIKHADLFYCYGGIRDNVVVKFFQSNNYELYNHSFFKVADQPALGPEYFLPRDSGLVTSQTFTTRLYKHTMENVERHTIYPY